MKTLKRILSTFKGKTGAGVGITAAGWYNGIEELIIAGLIQVGVGIIHKIAKNVGLRGK